MAKKPANAIRVYVDEFDFSGFLNSSSQDLTQETPVVTCFSDTGPRRVVGNYDFALKQMGFFDPADNSFDEQTFLLLADSDDHYIGIAYELAAENTIAYEFLVRNAAQPRSGATGGAVITGFDSGGSGGVSRSLVLASVTTTGAENRTGRNMGATSAGEVFQAVFRVLSFSGTDITLKIQESSDNGSGDAYADVAGLTSGALTAAGVVRTTTTAATEAWKRVNISGTYTSALVVVTAGLVAPDA